MLVLVVLIVMNSHLAYESGSIIEQPLATPRPSDCAPSAMAFSWKFLAGMGLLVFWPESPDDVVQLAMFNMLTMWNLSSVKRG